MKFLCIDCDEQMNFEARDQPGDGTFAASFTCPACGRRVAMLANPMETQLVNTLGVKIGGRTLDEQPMELIRSTIVGRDDAFRDVPSPSGDLALAGSGLRSSVRPRWSADASERLTRVPGFVRGMVKKIYSEYATERGIAEVTPDVMDRARVELGLEGM